VSRRTDQIGSTIQRAIQKILADGLADPRVRGLITVSGVEMSDDLRRAIVLVSVYPAEHQELTMHGLRSATGHLRRRLASATALPVLPQLVFRLDTTMKRQAAVLEALAKVAAEREEMQSDGNDVSAARDDPDAGFDAAPQPPEEHTS
jgi:ribosome-binding factor A